MENNVDNINVKFNPSDIYNVKTFIENENKTLEDIRKDFDNKFNNMKYEIKNK